MTWKTVSCKIDEEDFDTITSCIENGGAESVSKFVRDAIEHEIKNHIMTLESEDEPTPTKVREPIKLTCKNGELWTHWNEDRIRTKYGNTSDFDLNDGKVYKNGSLIGIIEHQD